MSKVHATVRTGLQLLSQALVDALLTRRNCHRAPLNVYALYVDFRRLVERVGATPKSFKPHHIICSNVV